MKFQFNIQMTDEDYWEYHKFWIIRSHYGKKQLLSMKILFTAVVAFLFFISLFGSHVSFNSFVVMISIIALVFSPFYDFIYGHFLKWFLKSMKKKGKAGYSPFSVMEFYEDHFVEMTEENKTEQKYSAIERISIVDQKTIYIHVNNIMAYFLPFACFQSKEQLDDFLEFIKTKCSNIDLY